MLTPADIKNLIDRCSIRLLTGHPEAPALKHDLVSPEDDELITLYMDDILTYLRHQRDGGDDLLVAVDESLDQGHRSPLDIPGFASSEPSDAHGETEVWEDLPDGEDDDEGSGFMDEEELDQYLQTVDGFQELMVLYARLANKFRELSLEIKTYELQHPEATAIARAMRWLNSGAAVPGVLGMMLINDVHAGDDPLEALSDKQAHFMSYLLREGYSEYRDPVFLHDFWGEIETIEQYLMIAESVDDLLEEEPTGDEENGTMTD